MQIQVSFFKPIAANHLNHTANNIDTILFPIPYTVSTHSLHTTQALNAYLLKIYALTRALMPSMPPFTRAEITPYIRVWVWLKRMSEIYVYVKQIDRAHIQTCKYFFFSLTFLFLQIIIQLLNRSQQTHIKYSPMFSFTYYTTLRNYFCMYGSLSLSDV